jgi:peptidoglycan/xylan/chitin deacetylase (PgdA/CDA1 family)
MLTLLRRSALQVSRHLGLSRLIGASAWRRQHLLVLCYHGVSLRDEHQWNPLLYMAPGTLDKRFGLLRQQDCTVLPLDEAVGRLYTNDLPDRAVALTFDDGYYDFKHRALPLLSKYGYPATVYLTTKRVDHNRPIVGLMLSYVLWMKRTATLDARDVPGLGDAALPLATAAQRETICARLDAEFHRQRLSPGQKDDAVREIAGRLGVDYDALAGERLLTLMNPGEVTALAARGVDFQLHTHRHRTPEDPDLFATEIRLNGERIQAMTGVAPTHFCYPSGVYRAPYLAVLRSAGVVSATTCERGIAGPHSNPLLMPRLVDTDVTSEAEFSGWVSGAAAWLPQRVRHGALIASEPASVVSSQPVVR